ncbi:MAG: ABC-F family ATP-binding cassette domain-containing protein [Bdellovibrionales bacterium]|nr:ABC-F family ATP-binding cassette domain-containing protein [Bdellovibrionales bacterium]
MSSLLQLQNGSKSYGPKNLFQDASFAINEGEHVGVIGPNGAGKTTLFKILIGQESLDHGQIIRSKSLRLGYLSQHDQWRQDQTVEEFLTQGVSGDGSEIKMPIWDLKPLGVGLGVTEDMYSRPIVSFSGGYRMRFKLLYLIATMPNLMLLDEPTNYLDLETLLVLENFLQNYTGAFLLISHDREFLRRTTDHIVEVETGDITKYNGNIDDYFEQKELLRTQLEARAMSLEEKRKEVLAFVARFGAKASKASQAQSRLKTLDKMEAIEVKPLPVGARIKIPPPARPPKLVFSLNRVDLGYPTRTVVKDVNFQVMGGDHVAVVGLNGAGKSTFLKTLSKEIPPMGGKIEYGFEVTLGYYAQHVAERLHADDTVFQAMGRNAHPSVIPQDVLNLAGSLLFSGDDVKKKISVLSGGEKARVALGQILLQKVSCLILDEPTNHLDFQTVEALTQSLKTYSGTVIVVSHDRSFMSRVGNKILEIKDGKISLHHGTYDEYVFRVGKEVVQSVQSKKPQTKSEPSNQAVLREQKKAMERDLKKSQKRLTELDDFLKVTQKKIEELNLKMAEDPAAVNRDSIEELSALGTALSQAEEEWLELSSKIEASI